MTPAARPNRIHNRALASGGAVVLALAVVAFLFGAHAPADEPPMTEAAPVAPPPAGDPPPAPEPEPEPPAVEGTVEVADVVDLSASGTGLYQESAPDGEPVPVDEEAIEAFAETLGAWLDAALTEVHEQGDAASLTAGLAGAHDLLHLGDPDHVIVEARYRVVVAALGTPEWAEVDLTVTRADGSERVAVLAVLPGSPPTLVGAGAPAVGRGADDGEADG